MGDEHIPQIKICGLTRVDEALACAELGADAVGFVFYPKSPRNVSGKQAGEICRALPGSVTTVGVFVDEPFYAIMQRVEQCGLKAVQLHGRESAELVERLRREKLLVIKALFADRKPGLKAASDYRASAYLVECGRGVLPGGNALEWDWGAAGSMGGSHPLILAGGLAPDNVCRAVMQAAPAAVDVSSGVESAPGRKDPAKVRAFIAQVRQCPLKTRADGRLFPKIFGPVRT